MTRPRVLFVGRTRYRLPLSSTLARKWDALAAELELRVLARGGGTRDERFALTLPDSGVEFHASLPLAIALELRRFRPDAVVLQDPFEAAAAVVARRLARSRAAIVVDVHGDWRTATRLYGSSVRRALTPSADAVAAWGLRRADAVRTISGFTSGLVRTLGIEPAAVFPAFTDLAAFAARPPASLPPRPRALFVGVLEPYKGVDLLADAWRKAALRVPTAHLLVVGRGSGSATVDGLVRELPAQTRRIDELWPMEVAAALDRSTTLVLPSRSEGLPRIVMESFCRGRAVVGARVGGIPDLVEDGRNGLLVGGVDELADALVRVLGDPALAERLGAGAAATDGSWRATPQEFAARTRKLVESALLN